MMAATTTTSARLSEKKNAIEFSALSWAAATAASRSLARACASMRSATHRSSSAELRRALFRAKLCVSSACTHSSRWIDGRRCALCDERAAHPLCARSIRCIARVGRRGRPTDHAAGAVLRMRRCRVRQCCTARTKCRLCVILWLRATFTVHQRNATRVASMRVDVVISRPTMVVRSNELRKNCCHTDRVRSTAAVRMARMCACSASSRQNLRASVRMRAFRVVLAVHRSCRRVVIFDEVTCRRRTRVELLSG